MIIRNDNITEASLGSSSDLNASAYISKLISSGGIVNSTIVDAVNNLFLDLKSNELYNKVKRFYPMVGASQSACSLEAKLTGHNILWDNSTGFVFNENGITCNGYDSRNPAYISQTPYAIFGSNTNIGFTMYNRTSRGAQAAFPIAANDGAGKRFQLNINYDGDSAAWLGASLASSTAGLSTGLFALSRTSDTSMKFYRNGVLQVEDTTSGSLNSDSQINLFDYTTDNFAFLSLNDGMNPTETLTFYTIVQNFQTALGRAV